MGVPVKRRRAMLASRLLTPVRINGTGPFSCMFDSGGTPLSLDTAVAGKAGLKPNGQGLLAFRDLSVVDDIIYQ
jgi:hypothetical protein